MTSSVCPDGQEPLCTQPHFVGKVLFEVIPADLTDEALRRLSDERDGCRVTAEEAYREASVALREAEYALNVAIEKAEALHKEQSRRRATQPTDVMWDSRLQGRIT